VRTPELVRRYLKPREGWLSLALLLVMVLSFGWSVQRADWFDRLDFLNAVALWAVVAGALFGLSRLSVAIVLPLAALLGTGIVLWTIGGEYFSDLSGIERLMALRSDAIGWIRIVLDSGYPSEVSPYAIGLGVITWVTAFIAAWTLYRYHRVLDAILLVGAALVANMSATFADLFGYIVLFSLAALLLWLRVALISREENWQQRRVTENAEVPTQIMRTGVTFIAGSIALAWILTTVAVAAPLTNVWHGLEGAWGDVRDGLDGVFGGLSNPDSRIRGTEFGSSFVIRGTWESGDEAVMTVAEQRPYYLRTITYDAYTGHGWVRTPGEERRVAPGDPVFPGYTAERPRSATAFELETITVLLQREVGRNIFTPGYPVAAFSPLIVREAGGLPLLGGLESAVPLEVGTGWQITAAISRATEAELAGAGTAYPQDVLATYLGTDGITQRTRDLAVSLAAAADASDPYHWAKALAAYLQRDPRFTYATRAPLPEDPDQDLVDFFLFDTENGQIGYCEYYATAMAMMARSLGIPARVAVGYAPGDRIEQGVYEYRERNAHLWAELYFPGYGWQIFESTKSIDPLVRLSGGSVVPPVGTGSGVDPFGEFEEGVEPGTISNLRSFEPVEGGFRPGEQKPSEEVTSGNAMIIVIILALVVALMGWRLFRARHRFTFLAPGDRQWQRLALAADRAGVTQRASETVYEYAGWLEEQLPRQRVEIHAIADGKVWQAYSGRSISAEAVTRIERAWTKLKLPIAWLAIRRRARIFFGRGKAD
jgi:transglutaminase-like putative cysteine protease